MNLMDPLSDRSSRFLQHGYDGLQPQSKRTQNLSCRTVRPGQFDDASDEGETITLFTLQQNNQPNNKCHPPPFQENQFDNATEDEHQFEFDNASEDEHQIDYASEKEHQLDGASENENQLHGASENEQEDSNSLVQKTTNVSNVDDGNCEKQDRGKDIFVSTDNQEGDKINCQNPNEAKVVCKHDVSPINRSQRKESPTSCRSSKTYQATTLAPQKSGGDPSKTSGAIHQTLSTLNARELPLHIKPIFRCKPRSTRSNVNMSPYRGVHPSGLSWISSISFENKKYVLGCFETDQEAAHMYAWAHEIIHASINNKTLQEKQVLGTGPVTIPGPTLAPQCRTELALIAPRLLVPSRNSPPPHPPAHPSHPGENGLNVLLPRPPITVPNHAPQHNTRKNISTDPLLFRPTDHALRIVMQRRDQQLREQGASQRHGPSTRTKYCRASSSLSTRTAAILRNTKEDATSAELPQRAPAALKTSQEKHISMEEVAVLRTEKAESDSPKIPVDPKAGMEQAAVEDSQVTIPMDPRVSEEEDSVVSSQRIPTVSGIVKEDVMLELPLKRMVAEYKSTRAAAANQLTKKRTSPRLLTTPIKIAHRQVHNNKSTQQATHKDTEKGHRSPPPQSKAPSTTGKIKKREPRTDIHKEHNMTKGVKIWGNRKATALWTMLDALEHPSQLLVPSENADEEQHLPRHQPVPPSSSTTTSPVITPECLTDRDIISGRGGKTNGNPGNQWYRDLVASYRPMYAILAKFEKNQMAQNLVNYIRLQGGRFLEQHQTDRSISFLELGDERAVLKTSQALREGSALLTRDVLKRSLPLVADTFVSSMEAEVPPRKKSRRSHTEAQQAKNSAQIPAIDDDVTVMSVPRKPLFNSNTKFLF